MYDKKQLRKIGQLKELAPEAFEGFAKLDDTAFVDGAIPRKYKELMAIAVAQNTGCVYCLDIHARLARKNGATEAEIGEAVMVGVAMAAGKAITHGAHVLADND